MKRIALALLFLISFHGFGQTEIHYPDSSDCLWYIPNVITMNCQRAYHDYELEIYCDCELEQFEITIYNRWGEVMFFSEKITAIWQAGDVPQDTYIYHIKAITKSGYKFDFKGHTTVLK